VEIWNHIEKNQSYFKSDHLVYKYCYHVIFCPKYRKAVLISDISNRLKEICFEVALKHDFIIEEIETDKDHVHMIINCNPIYGVMKCVQILKQVSAYKIFQEYPFIKKRYLWGGQFWSRSSFVSTVGSVSLETVKTYIENQGK